MNATDKISLVTLSRSSLGDDLFEICRDYPIPIKTEKLFLHCTMNQPTLTLEEIEDLSRVFDDHKLLVEVLQ